MNVIRFAAAFAGLALLTGAMAQTTPHPAFQAEIPVLVLDHHGQPIPGLDADRFRVSDDDRAQQVLKVDGAELPLSVAIVVDASDRDALAQVKRSANLMAAMVVGETGEAAVYVSGPQPKQVLDFTSDGDKLANVLQHLTLAPTAPLGQGTITEPANLALLALAHRPQGRTRALVLVSRDAARTGENAQALTEAVMAEAMGDAISIFRISPVALDGSNAPVNPDSPAVQGKGVGSQRDTSTEAGVAARGQVTSATTDAATVNLTPLLGAARHVTAAVVDPHDLDYVWDSGGLTLSAGDNASFDTQLSSVGADLRSLYRIYYQPNDLAGVSREHLVSLNVLAQDGEPPIGKIAYRRAYLAPAPRP